MSLRDQIKHLNCAVRSILQQWLLDRELDKESEMTHHDWRKVKHPHLNKSFSKNSLFGGKMLRFMFIWYNVSLLNSGVCLRLGAWLHMSKEHICFY